jgi:hypothetical protein
MRLDRARPLDGVNARSSWIRHFGFAHEAKPWGHADSDLRTSATAPTGSYCGPKLIDHGAARVSRAFKRQLTEERHTNPVASTPHGVATGATIDVALAGPVGVVVRAALGAVAGALGGHAAGAVVNAPPIAER